MHIGIETTGLQTLSATETVPCIYWSLVKTEACSDMTDSEQERKPIVKPKYQKLWRAILNTFKYDKLNIS